ncbi:hypothetical protein JOM56_012301 [Amanita muscaria]
MHARPLDSTVGLYNAIASDIISHSSEDSTEMHWISESGILDLFLMAGPRPEQVFKQYASLTGVTPLPTQWSWLTTNKRFDEEGMPVDVFWLDLPDPVGMINDVAGNGRKMVVIVGPHLKRTQDYPVYKQAYEHGLLVRKRSMEGDVGQEVALG